MASGSKLTDPKQLRLRLIMAELIARRGEGPVTG